MALRYCWLGHSCLLFENKGIHVLIDPFLTGNPIAPVKAEDVPADFILISHGHSDHVGDAIEIAERTGATVVANFEIATWFQEKMGIRNVHGMQHGGAFSFPFGKLKLTLAFHGSALPDGSNGGNPCGFLIKFTDSLTVYDAADTGLFGDMKLIGEEGIDLSFVPIGDNFTMGPEDAVKACQFLKPKTICPIHYNTFPLIAQNEKLWAEQITKQTQARPRILQPGVWVED